MTETKPQNRRLGCARVSTYGQTLDAQLAQLRKAGCIKIFRETVTGARADPRELLTLLKAITPGDVVTVTRRARGRGARSYLHSHGGRQEPGKSAGPAYGPTTEAHAAAAEGSTAAADAGRNAE